MNVNEKKVRVISEPMDLELMKACHFRRKGMSPMACGIKRLLDVAGSLAGMILTSPLFLIICLFIKREDGGPVIFRQERIGYGGKPFTLYKFRSMSVTSEADGIPALCQKNDKRLTRTGRFLREHHLDELPQFWNVFKGEMSFVGPRPENASSSQNESSLSTPIMNCCTNCVRDCFPPPPCITVTPTRWKRCWNASVWIWSIYATAPYGWISKLFS